MLLSNSGEVSFLAVKTSHPVSVIKIVCSNCADLFPSEVTFYYLKIKIAIKNEKFIIYYVLYFTAVQSSIQVISFQDPKLIIGSIVKI